MARKTLALSFSYPGVSRVFEEGAKLRLFDFQVLGDGADISLDYDQYLFGAMTILHPVFWNSFIVNELKHKSIGVLWTSSTGELDLEPIEQQQLQTIVYEPKVDFVWFGDELLGRIWKKGFYVSYPIKVDFQAPVKSKANIITLWCPRTKKKNILNQLMAVSLLQKEQDIVLHTNVDTEVLKLDLNTQKYDSWLERAELHTLIASARVNLAVSWAETFNYQVAEATMLGTPSVVSRALPWVSIVNTTNPSDPQEIADAIRYALNSPELCLESLRNDLNRYATHSMDIGAKLDKHVLK